MNDLHGASDNSEFEAGMKYDHRLWLEIGQNVLKQGGQLHTEIYLLYYV